MTKPRWTFYDTETSGLQVAFDQVLQFAAVVTDDHFNPLEVYEFKVKWAKDTIPHPLACLTHRLTAHACASGLTENQAISVIHQLLNRPNTINLGYNSINFDDEVLRFSFYRHLLPPYDHQFAGGCKRADIYPLTVLAHVLQPDLLDWPKNPETGRLSLKLDAIAQANHWLTGRAHDALTDVYATVSLAKQLKSHPEFWQQAIALFDKQLDQSSLIPCDALWPDRPNAKVAILIDGKFGHKNGFAAPAICLGQHQKYRNQTLWLRLDEAVEHLVDRDFSLDELPFSLISRKKWGEPPYILPTNQANHRLLSDLQHQKMECSLSYLSNNPEHYRQLSRYFCSQSLTAPARLDVQASLYQNGFWNDHEKALCRKIRAAKPGEREALLASIGSPTLKALAERFLWRNCGEDAPSSSSGSSPGAAHMKALASPESSPNDHAGRQRLDALTAYKQTLECIRGSTDVEDRLILTQLCHYLENHFDGLKTA